MTDSTLPPLPTMPSFGDPAPSHRADGEQDDYAVVPPSGVPTAAATSLPLMAPPVGFEPQRTTPVMDEGSEVPSIQTFPVAPVPIERPADPSPTTMAAPQSSMVVEPPPAAAPGAERFEVARSIEERLPLDDLLLYLNSKGGSDLHLTAGAPPVIRVHGHMEPVEGYAAPLTGSMIQDAIFAVMTAKQKARFEEDLEMDFAYQVPGEGRFRVNVFRQQESVDVVMRTIPWEIKSLETLGMPAVMNNFSQLERGLVLVTGPTGSGKSTTLAAIIDQANRTRKGNIVTIEDPIEFLHQHRKSIVRQREVGRDTHSFKEALKRVLRQDPDIILIGELRDLETISVALTAAETGHLVFGTLHTQSAGETVTRVVDVFPAEQQQQVLTQLAACLQGIVCQTLCRTADETGRVAAVEVLLANAAVRNIIRQRKLDQIESTLQSSRKDGMQSLDQHLSELVKSGRITYDEGFMKAANQTSFADLAGSREAAELLQRQRAAAATQMGSMTPPSLR